MRILTLCSLGALGAVLGACTTPVDSSPSPVFGRAVATMQSQIIPATVSALAPEEAGAPAAAAIARYEKGEPKKLEVTGTSNLNSTAQPYSGK